LQVPHGTSQSCQHGQDAELRKITLQGINALVSGWRSETGIG